MRLVSYAMIVMLLVLAACQGENDSALGHASLALESVSPSGTTYRLRNLVVVFTDLNLPASEPPIFSDSVDGATSLEVDLPPSTYAAGLSGTYVLQRGSDQDADGVLSFEDLAPEQVLLTSPNPVEVNVFEQQVSHVSFAFKVGDELIQFGKGRVQVDFTVDDGAQTCAAGETLCGGACVDASSDDAHCGGCGIACLDGTSCNAGTCIRPPYVERGECAIGGADGDFGIAGASLAQCESECEGDPACIGYSVFMPEVGVPGRLNCWRIHSCNPFATQGMLWRTYCRDPGLCPNTP
jgi:hypothetical protein